MEEGAVPAAPSPRQQQSGAEQTNIKMPSPLPKGRERKQNEYVKGDSGSQNAVQSVDGKNLVVYSLLLIASFFLLLFYCAQMLLITTRPHSSVRKREKSFKREITQYSSVISVQ